MAGRGRNIHSDRHFYRFGSGGFSAASAGTFQSQKEVIETVKVQVRKHKYSL